MKRLTVDASVSIKWLLPQRPGEDHAEHALHLLEDIREGRVELLQPPHWLAEVGAVLARLEPQLAAPALRLLDAMDIAMETDPDIYETALSLAIRLDHHPFDTLYHAIPLTGKADYLLTADMRYYRKGREFSRIHPLADYSAV